MWSRFLCCLLRRQSEPSCRFLLPCLHVSVCHLCLLDSAKTFVYPERRGAEKVWSRCMLSSRVSSSEQTPYTIHHTNRVPLITRISAMTRIWGILRYWCGQQKPSHPFPNKLNHWWETSHHILSISLVYIETKQAIEWIHQINVRSVVMLWSLVSVLPKMQF